MSIYAALACEASMGTEQGEEIEKSREGKAPKTSKRPSSHPTRHYLTPHVCIVEGSQHIWTQNFITSLFQKHLGTRFIFSLSMQRAVKHKRDLWRHKRTWLYIAITSEWRDGGRHTLCAHMCMLGEGIHWVCDAAVQTWLHHLQFTTTILVNWKSSN